MNTFGNILRLTTFGESHGPAMGGVIDGLPAGLTINLDRVAGFVARRRPGTNTGSTSRREADNVEYLSGLMPVEPQQGDGDAKLQPLCKALTLGTPVAFIIRNTDCKAKDYETLRDVYRPSHADYTWEARYNGIRDWRGGGRSSGRETVSRVVAGAFAMQMIETKGISISTAISRIGNVENPSDPEIENVITTAQASADSVGGWVRCTISGMPAGIGEPVFGKLDQMLASAMMSIGAVKGVEIGMGFQGVCNFGSAVADEMDVNKHNRVIFKSNHSGGIQGGISNGNEISLNVAVKPTPSIQRELGSVNRRGEPVKIKVAGRHDACILPRVMPVIEAMAALTLTDAIMMRYGTEYFISASKI